MSSDAIIPAELQMRFVEGRDKPSLVFTHGWANDCSVWDGVIDRIDRRHRCLSWSLRGHGASEITAPGTYTRDHALADFDVVLNRALEAGGGEPCVLVGHSLGGYLSLAQALRRPSDVAGLVLVAAGPGFRKPEAREQWNANVVAQASKLGVAAGSEVISMHYDSWVIDEIGSVKAPTLVILGERDRAFAASAAVFEKYLDVRSTVVVPDAGHSVHLKQPDAVAAAIADFVSTLS